MEDKTLDDVNKIFVQDNEDKKELERIDSYLDQVNKSLASFIKAQINSVTSKENLATKIQKALEMMVDIMIDKMAKNQDVKVEEILPLFKAVTQSANISSESILNLLKPTPGGENRLLQGLSENDSENDKAKEMFDNLSNEDIQKMEAFSKMFTTLANQNYENTKNKENQENT